MNKGFTIIELIISIFILSVAVVGIFSAFSIVVILTSDTANQLTATYLAQEGMEIVRNIRDTNWLNMDAYSSGTNPNPASWVDGLVSSDNGAINQPVDCSCTTADCSSKGCEADYTTGTGVSGAWAMSSGASHYLYIDTNGFYGYNTNSATATKFKRKIIITPVTDVDNVANPYHILDVKVQVSWDKKATILNSGVSAGTCLPLDNNCVTAEETLYNWYNTSILVTSVKLNKTIDNLQHVGNVDSLMVTIFPIDNQGHSLATDQKVTWTSTDESVATVNNGLVTATGLGTADIIVTTEDGSKTAKCSVTVGSGQ